MVIGLFIYFFVPETKGYTLEETAVLYDGVEALLELQRTAEEQVILDKVRTIDEIAKHEPGDVPADLEDTKDLPIHTESTQVERLSARGPTAV